MIIIMKADKEWNMELDTTYKDTTTGTMINQIASWIAHIIYKLKWANDKKVKTLLTLFEREYLELTHTKEDHKKEIVSDLKKRFKK